MSILTEEEPTGINRDYGRRQYVDAEPVANYVDSMRRVTDKAMFNQALGKQSELKKPYQAESFEEMEHFYEKQGVTETSPFTPLTLPPSPSFDVVTGEPLKPFEPIGLPVITPPTVDLGRLPPVKVEDEPEIPTTAPPLTPIDLSPITVPEAEPPVTPPPVIPDIVTPVVVPGLPVVVSPIVVPTIEPPLEPEPGIDVGIVVPPIVVTTEGIDDVVIVVTELDTILEETVVPVIIPPDVVPIVVVIATPILTDITLPVPEEPDLPPDTPPEPPFDVTGDPPVVPVPPGDAVIRTIMSVTLPITAAAGATIVGTGTIDSWLTAGFWEWEGSSSTPGIEIAIRVLGVRGTQVEITVKIDSSVTTQDISIVLTAKNTISTERPSAIASVSVTGGGSALFTASNQYITIADSTDFTGSPWTVDFWVRLKRVTGDRQYFFFHHTFDSLSFHGTSFSFFNNELNFYTRSQGGSTVNFTAGWTPSVDTWYHIAVIRGWAGNNNIVAITVNGTSIGTVAIGFFHPDASASFLIGHLSESLDGNMDEFRYSRTDIPWTANFTPATEPYEVELDAGKGSVLLMHMNGINGSTDFPDAAERHSPVSVNNVTVDTLIKKF